MSFADLPLDVLHPILAHLPDRKDWHSCALVNKEFNKVATPLLYGKLDSRIRQSRLYHPSATLINRPALAKYVRCITETGTVHFANRHLQPNITYDTVHALSLCTNLRSMKWSDDSLSTSYVAFSIPFFSNDNNSLVPSPNTGLASSIYHGTTSQSHDTDLTHPLLLLLAAIKAAKAPLAELVIRSHSDLGPLVWSELSKWRGLTKIEIWCMEGPPRVLQGWAGPELGKTLTDLELGRCAGVPPTILNSIFSQLPLLQHLCLKGASPAAVLTILTFLPSLQTLDTEYLDSGSGNIWPRGWQIQVFTPGAPPSSLPSPNDGDQPSATAGRVLMPTLRNLTVRTSSIDAIPNKLFTWIRALVTNPGLESLRLLTFTTSGNIAIPRGFILEMGRVHGGDAYPFNAWPPKNGVHGVAGDEGAVISESGNEKQTRKKLGLCKWIVGQAEMTLADIECVCKSFPELEELVCSVAVVMGHVDSIVDAISSANNLQTLRLQVQWIPRQYRRSSASRLPWGSGSTNGRHTLDMGDAAASDADPELLEPNDSEDGEDSDSEYDLAHIQFAGGRGGAFLFDEVGMQRTMFNLFGPGSSRPSSYPLQSPSRAGTTTTTTTTTNGRHSDGHHDHDGNNSGNGNGSGKGKRGNGGEMNGGGGAADRLFTLDHARAMMLREGSKLRVIVVGRVLYTGKWVWDALEGEAQFKIDCLGGEE